MREHQIGETRIVLMTGDITRQDTEAIVNAANSSLMGGGGVDGAIHKAGGPAILEECKEIRRTQGKLPTGKAVITTGGNLTADFVIHTVGPVWKGGNQREEEKLAEAYYNSLQLALQKGIKTIAFPSISTGAYRFPLKKASIIALTTIKNFIEKNEGLKEVRLVTYSDKDYQVYSDSWQEIIGQEVP